MRDRILTAGAQETPRRATISDRRRNPLHPRHGLSERRDAAGGAAAAPSSLRALVPVQTPPDASSTETITEIPVQPSSFSNCHEGIIL